MNYLNKIIMPVEGSRCICVFYTTILGKTGTYNRDKNKVDPNKQRSKHCEMFTKSELTSVKLNKESFVLRFASNEQKRNIKLKFSNPAQQVEALAGLIEHSVGSGLKVFEYYKEFINENKE